VLDGQFSGGVDNCGGQGEAWKCVVRQRRGQKNLREEPYHGRTLKGEGGIGWGGHLLPVSQALPLCKAGLAGACLSARLAREKYDC
jgi:hypothetical protein